jgi:hypothetical protein
MANIQDAFPSNYLKASDLKGAQPVVTIDRVEFEPVGRSKEMKPILYLVGKEKGLVLNKTNSNNITNLAGTPETDEWPGIRLRLYSTHVEFQGDTVEAIRIKAAPPQAAARQAPKQAAPPPPPMPVDEPPMDITDDDIPF